MKRIGDLLIAPLSVLTRETTIVILILLVATFFRAHLFEAAPPGLQHDEIFKGNFAQEILDGGWPVFFDANGGEEALFPYLAAVSISLFGHNFFALRMVSLVCALLSIVFSYCLIREFFGRRVAALTTLGLAISFWHVFDSRVALRPITLLLMAVVSFYCYWLGLKRGKVVWFVFAGLCMGGAFYTYTSGLLVPLTVVAFTLVYQLPFDRAVVVKRWRGMLLAFVIALIVFLPVGYHVYTHPVASTARVRDLSDHVNLFLAGDPGPLLSDVRNVVGIFGVKGDPEWRYNLAGRPIFDPVTFVLFCAGLVICLARIRRPEYAFLLFWLCINMVPSALTRHSPSTLRAIGSLTPVYVLPSLAMDLCWGWGSQRFGSLARRAVVAALALLFAFNAFSTYRDYFTVWAENEEVRSVYRADLTAVARYLDESVEDETVCLSASFAADLDQQVLNFMLREPRPIKWFDGRQSLVFPEPSSSREVLYVFPATCPLRKELVNRFFAHLPVVESVLDPDGEPAFVAYRLTSEEVNGLRAIQPEHRLAVNLGDRIELLGYELPGTVQAGEEVSLLLYWRVSQPIRPDLLYTFFAHVVDMRGYLWAQADTVGYPVSSWIEGDLVIQWFDLAIPADSPPLEYQVKMGMYDPVTGARLGPAVEGVPLPDGVVASVPFSVGKAETPPDIDQLDIPRRRQANFDGKLNLLGCDLSPVPVGAGDAVHVSLYWQALAQPETGYLISVSLTDEEGNVWKELLRKPLDGDYPTTEWVEGQVVRDRFDLHIDASVPDGKYRLYLRLYDPSRKAYLPIVDTGEDRVRLARIRILGGNE